MDDFDPRSLAGTLVGDRYKIVELLKRGAFSLSFRATDQEDGRGAYLRLFTCPPDALEEVERALASIFVRSAQVMSELSRADPAIVKTQLARRPHTLPDGRKVPWVVSEWIDGETLTEWRNRATEDDPRPSLSVESAYARFQGVVALLVRAHDRGIVHRRLDPAQLWVIGGNPDGALKVDGFSGRPGAGEGPRIPAGVPRDPPSTHHAAPEQQLQTGPDREGPWTDVYSLAMLMLDAMLGRTTAWEEWDRRRHAGSDEPTAAGVLPTPRRLGLTVSDDAEAVFACALQPDPDLRFRSMREFRDAIEQVLEGGPITWTRQAFAAKTKAVGTFNNPTPRPPPSSEPPAPPVTMRISEDENDDTEPPARPSGVMPSVAEVDFGDEHEPHHTVVSSTPPNATPTHRPTRPATPRRYAPWFIGGAIVAAVLVATVRGTDGEMAAPPPEATPAHAAVGTPPPVPPPAPKPKPPPPPAPPRCPPEMVAIDVTNQPDDAARLASYCLQRHEVTVAQYQACTVANACTPPLHESSWPQGSEPERAANSELCNWRYGDRGTHPVNCLTWEQAQAYCRFRGWRLPSNAEWSFAAVGPEARTYPWGEDPPDETRVNGCGLECRAWRADRKLEETEVLYETDDRFPGTAPVGSFPAGATPSGLEDLAGNVFEWVADVDAADPDLRTIRGGGFDQYWAEALLPAAGVRQRADAYAHALGFRCAMSLK